MSEKHKAKKAEEQYKSEMEAWQSEHDELTAVLQAATTRTGSPSSDIMLKSGEAVFASVGNASLVEDRRGAGHYAGTSQGFSIPVGSVGGRSVRYRVGANKGHFVQGELHPQAVDQGKLVITNRRVLFVGGRKTIERLFAKLVGAEVSGGELALSVSNRQKVTRVHYGRSWMDGFRCAGRLPCQSAEEIPISSPLRFEAAERTRGEVTSTSNDVASLGWE
jgi:hypothetical protein